MLAQYALDHDSKILASNYDLLVYLNIDRMIIIIYI